MSEQPDSPAKSATNRVRLAFRILFVVAALIVAGVLVWQGITSGGNPDPTAPNTSPTAALLNIAVLVFREGLECILVLSAITASMIGDKQAHRRPVLAGAGIAFVASIITWFIAVGIVSNLAMNVSALNLQAATGLLAVLVLLVIMNWFFHKIYWGGWMSMHNRRRKALVNSAANPETSKTRLIWGLGLLGFTSLYREGFEVVLFLQSYYLRMGSKAVLSGALLGLFFTGIVAVLTFVAHRRLPYRKMLILTGTMLGVVLLVMVGEQAQEMQLAHWIPTTPIARLENVIPPWMGLWFAVFPTVETILAQLLAAVVVVGSYFLARGKTSPPCQEQTEVILGHAANCPIANEATHNESGKCKECGMNLARNPQTTTVRNGLKIPLMLLFFTSCFWATNSFAHGPMSRQVKAKIIAIDNEHRLIRTEFFYKSKPESLVWNENTKFIQNGKFVSSDSLKTNDVVELSYRSPFFGSRFVTKVNLLSQQTTQ